MRKVAGFAAVLLSLVVLAGCSSTKTVTVQVPPRADLQGFGTLGLVDFSSNASPSIDAQTTREFGSHIHAAQPGTRIVKLGNRDSLERAAARHYVDVISRSVEVDTPNPEVDRALAAAQIALEQAWVCNPDLGCSQVAGYGPSRKARRPQYDWFFNEDESTCVVRETYADSEAVLTHLGLLSDMLGGIVELGGGVKIEIETPLMRVRTP